MNTKLHCFNCGKETIGNWGISYKGFIFKFCSLEHLSIYVQSELNRIKLYKDSHERVE